MIPASEEAKRLKRDIDRGEDPMDARTKARHAPIVDELIGTTQRYAHLINSPLRAGVTAVGEMLKPRLKVVGR